MLLIMMLTAVVGVVWSASLPDALNHENEVYTPKKVDWNAEGQNTLNAILQRQQVTKRAKNVIIFVGDGMGLSTIAAARIYQTQAGKTDPKMSFEKFPYVSLSKTYSVDHSVPDSAATATAIFCGVKTNQNTVGVNQNAIKNNCKSSKGNEVDSILHWSQAKGKSVGVVSTSKITDATPAAIYASSANRAWQAYVSDPKGGCKDIAHQLVKQNPNIQVILGGGRANFLPNTQNDVEYPNKKGKRKDGVNLVEEWIKEKVNSKKTHRYVWNLTEFDNVDPDKTDYLFGLFEPSYMQFELDRNKDVGKEPSLKQMVEKSINILKRNDKGYFLMVEGGRIDHGHHITNAKRAITETLSLSEAVDQAVQMTEKEDTLIVVTSDHSHALSISGYPSWKAPILGVTDKKLASDGKPFTILSYANGPGFKATRQYLTNKETMKDDYLQPSVAPLEYASHSGEDVAVYARGPMSHLFQGVQEENYIAHVMAYASCVGNKKTMCDAPN